MADPSRETWFHDYSYDDIAYIELDQELMGRIYGLIKDVKLKTTDNTRNTMNAAFDGVDWAVRGPMIRRGTTATGDNYRKGNFSFQMSRFPKKNF